MSAAEEAFGSVPSGQEVFAQALQGYQTGKANAEADAASAQAQQTVAALQPAPAQVYAPYLAPEKKAQTYDLYDGTELRARVPISELIAARQANPDYVITTADATGQRRGVRLGDLDHAMAQGHQLSTTADDAVERFRRENEGVAGTAAAAALSFTNQGLMGLPEIIGAHTQDPLQLAKREAVLKDHELASAIGGTAGFLASMSVGGPLFKGAAKAGVAVEQGVTRALASSIAAKSAEAMSAPVATGLAKQIVAAAAGHAVEGAVVAAPQVATELALGDPKEAAETLLMNVGIGGLFGGSFKGGQGLVRKALAGVPGLRVGAGKALEGEGVRLAVEAAAGGAENAAVDASLGDAAEARAPGDGGGAGEPPPPVDANAPAAPGVPPSGGTPPGAPGAPPPAAGGLGGLPDATITGTVSTPGAKGQVDKAAEAYIMGRPESERAALRLGYQKNATSQVARDDLTEAVAQNFKEKLDTGLRAAEKVREEAFGLGREKQISALIPEELGSKGYEGVLQMRRDVEGSLASLEATVPGGADAIGIRKVRAALDHLDNRLMTVQQMGAAPADMSREANSAANQLKQAIGRGAGMNKTVGSRNPVERELYDLYHQVIPVLESEEHFGPAGTAQKEVNAATSKALARSQDFHSGFTANFESKAGNAITESDPKDVVSYIKNAGKFETSETEKSLQSFIDGVNGQMDAVEKHYDLPAATKRQFAEARESLAQLRATAEQAKSDAKALALLESLKADETSNRLTGLTGMLANVALDFKWAPTSTIDKLAGLRKLAGRVDKLGVFTAEQSMKASAEKLDGIPASLRSMTDRARGITADGAASKPSIGLHDANPGDRYERFKKQADAMGDAQATLGGMNDKMQSLAKVFSDYGAPNIGSEFVTAQQRAIKYLYETMPKSTAVRMPFSGPDRWRPSDAQMLSWERRQDVVEDPFRLFEHVRQGTLMPEHVDAVKQVYPAFYDRFVQKIVEHASDVDAPVLPLRIQQQLAQMAGMQLPSQKASAQKMQKNFGEAEPGQIKSSSGKTKVPSAQTQVDRISGG